jgi:predicted nucleotidyltransferase
MLKDLSNSVPEPHRQFLEKLLERLRDDNRIVGVAAEGSYLTNSMDEFSDLDLLLAIEPIDYKDVMADRRTIAASLGHLLAAFTGEHVGEPSILICLYADPLLHVDLKFTSLDDVAKQAEDPAVLWEREERFTRALGRGKAKLPAPDPQWIEDRFWVWVHYIAVKIGRGELFETIDGLSYLRSKVLGPMALSHAGAFPAGVRKIEIAIPDFARELRRTIPRYDAADCLRALRACAELYRPLRAQADDTEFRADAERAAMEYVANIEERFGRTG